MEEELVANGRLVDSTGAKTSWPGYRVTFELTELVTLGEATTPVASAVELSAEVDLDGHFRVVLPAASKIAPPITLKVIAPAGEVLVSRTFAPDDFAETVPVAVTPVAVFEIPRSGDPFRGEKPKITGRVLDFEGKKQVSGRQVILFANRGALDEAVVVARTDGQGYFSADYPRAIDDQGQPAGPLTMTAAYAMVAGAHDVGGSDHIGVALVAMFGFENVLPRNVLLVVRLDDETLAVPGSSSDCACDQATPRAPDANDLVASSAYSTDLGGKCVNLNVPNRALEEYSYFTVVRTTDPEIVGTQDGSIDVAPIARVREVLAGLSDVLPAVAPPPPRSALVAPPPVTVAEHRTRAPVNATMLKRALDRRGASLESALDEAVRDSEVAHATTMLKRLTPRPAGRAVLNARNRIRWDDDVKFYEATSIAHGHLLHFKQVWRADGYSLGDLLYSLPLAPGQKKQIAVVDWERRDTGRRDETRTESESLENLLERDRDISEIVNTALSEQMHGESTSLTMGAGHGSGAAGSGSYGGFSMGAVSGTAMSGGYSQASADQNAARDLAASASQKIRDKTFQAASAVRNQRSTVIQTVAQGEAVTVTTEVVANHNHCHAMTIEYFEVLRHFVVDVQIAAVSECLYVPLEMAPFTRAKALRWRDQLARFCRKPALLPGFDAMQRNEEGDSDLPDDRYADEEIKFLEGSLTIEVKVPTGASEGIIHDTFEALRQFLFGSDPKNPNYNPGLQIDASGSGSGTPLPITFTMLGDPVPNVPIAVRMYPSAAIPPLPRVDVTGIDMRWDVSKSPFPSGSVVIIRSARMRYRTAHLAQVLFDEPYLNTSVAQQQVHVDTPLNQTELRNPHKEDEALEKKLLAHLNEHLEYYHKAIWWGMDADRRFMLLDGFVAPNAGGRSVASVVENRLIGFVGNSMILPVGHGIQLDPTYTKGAQTPASLRDLYAFESTPPVRISVPTRGVFAEAVMGSCNACEEKDETRLWRWDESPIDEPTAIQSPSTDSRKAAQPDLTAQAFPTPMIQIQSGPALPDPTGLAAALKVIGTPNLFPNVTGLELTEKNSLEAMKANLEAAKYFGGEASKLAQQASMQKGGIDKSLQAISQAEKSGMITADQRKDLTEKALKGLIGEGAGDPKKKGAIEELAPSVKKQVDKGSVKSIEAESDGGEKLKADFQPNLTLASLEGGDDGSLVSVATSTSAITSASMLVPVAIIDRIFADGIAGVVVTLTPSSGGAAVVTSAKSSAGGSLLLDLSQVDDGSYELRARPDDPTRWDDPVGPSLVGSLPRMWRSETAVVAIKGKQIINVLDPIGIPSDRFTFVNGRLRVLLEPVWVSQRRRFPGPHFKAYDPITASMIVVHHTGSPDTNDGAASVRSMRDREEQTPHYVIHHNGEITKMVNDDERAPHVSTTSWKGQSNVGARSIGIELANRAQPYTENQINSLVGLLQRLVAELGIDRTQIVGHSDVALSADGTLGARDIDPSEGNTSDPGQHFEWSRLQQAGLSIDPVLNNPDATGMYGGVFASGPTATFPASGPAIAELRADLENIGYKARVSSSVAGVRDAALTNALRQFILHFFSGLFVPDRRKLKTSGGNEAAATIDFEVADMIKRVKAAPH